MIYSTWILVTEGNKAEVNLKQLFELFYLTHSYFLDFSTFLMWLGSLNTHPANLHCCDHFRLFIIPIAKARMKLRNHKKTPERIAFWGFFIYARPSSLLDWLSKLLALALRTLLVINPVGFTRKYHTRMTRLRDFAFFLLL